MNQTDQRADPLPYEAIEIATRACAACANGLRQYTRETLDAADYTGLSRITIRIDALIEQVDRMVDHIERVDRILRPMVAAKLSAAGRQGYHGDEGALTAAVVTTLQPRTSDLMTPGATADDPAYAQSFETAMESATQRLAQAMRSAGYGHFIDETPNLERLLASYLAEGRSPSDVVKVLGRNAVEVVQRDTVEVIR